MANYTVTCANGEDLFVEKVEADTVDTKGEVVLFLRKVIPARAEDKYLDEDKYAIVAGFPRDRLLSFIAEVADEPALSRYVA